MESTLYKSQILYHSFLNDTLVEVSNSNLSLLPSLQSHYQDMYSNITLISPELVLVLNEFTNTYIKQKTLNVTPVATFDSFTNNLNFYNSEGVTYFMLFALYA